jgi:hypothetical protein
MLSVGSYGSAFMPSEEEKSETAIKKTNSTVCSTLENLKNDSQGKQSLKQHRMLPVSFCGR